MKKLKLQVKNHERPLFIFFSHLQGCIKSMLELDINPKMKDVIYIVQLVDTANLRKKH